MKMYVVSPDDFCVKLFQKAETITCTEMSESWLKHDYPKQIRSRQGNKLALKRGDAVAVSLGYQGGAEIFSVFKVEK